MGFFDRYGFHNYTTNNEPEPMPEDTNCENSSYENGIWEKFKMHARSNYKRVVSWYRIERTFYKATLDDGGVIFFIGSSLGNYAVRSLSADEAQFKTEEEWCNEFSNRLWYLLDSRRMTQNDVSKITGISTSALSYYYQHKRVPSSYALRQIANACKTTTEFLLNF